MAMGGRDKEGFEPSTSIAFPLGCQFLCTGDFNHSSTCRNRSSPYRKTV